MIILPIICMLRINIEYISYLNNVNVSLVCYFYTVNHNRKKKIQFSSTNQTGQISGNIPLNQTHSMFIPPPPHKKCALQDCRFDLCSQCSPRAVCSCLRHLHPFLLYQSKIIIQGGGYNTARGLISRDIARFPSFPIFVFMGKFFSTVEYFLLKK